jgi:hypothetical protein
MADKLILAKVTYADLKAKLEANGGLDITPTDVGGDLAIAQTNMFTGTFTIEVPQLAPVIVPMNDITFETDIRGSKEPNLFELLGLKKGNGGVQNNSSNGGQIILNSDRIILNSRNNYLMLFGSTGVAISSKGNVNIDAEDAVTIYGEDGLFLGVPGKGDKLPNKKAPKTKAEATKDNEYDPLVLGGKLAGLLEDLFQAIAHAVIVTPVGKAYFREDSQHEFANLKARLPEILSSWGYIDGISHEDVDPAPEPPKTITEPPTTLTGTVTGIVGGVGTTPMDPNAPSDTITNPLADQPGFYESVNLY